MRKKVRSSSLLSHKYKKMVAEMDQDTALRKKLAKRGGPIPSHIEIREDMPNIIKAHKKWNDSIG